MPVIANPVKSKHQSLVKTRAASRFLPRQRDCRARRPESLNLGRYSLSNAGRARTPAPH